MFSEPWEGNIILITIRLPSVFILSSENLLSFCYNYRPCSEFIFTCCLSFVSHYITLTCIVAPFSLLPHTFPHFLWLGFKFLDILSFSLYIPTVFIIMVRFVTPFVLASLSVTAFAAQSCSSSSQCNEKYPCCSRE